MTEARTVCTDEMSVAGYVDEGKLEAVYRMKRSSDRVSSRTCFTISTAQEAFFTVLRQIARVVNAQIDKEKAQRLRRTLLQEEVQEMWVL